MLARGSARLVRGHARGVGWASRTLWGAASNVDQLSEELEVDSPVPLFDGATPTKVRFAPVPSSRPSPLARKRFHPFPRTARFPCFPMDSRWPPLTFRRRAQPLGCTSTLAASTTPSGAQRTFCSTWHSRSRTTLPAAAHTRDRKESTRPRLLAPSRGPHRPPPPAPPHALCTPLLRCHTPRPRLGRAQRTCRT